MQSRHSKLYCLCSRDIQNFIVCAINRDIQNFIVCAVATFKTLFVQSRHSKLYCLCSRAIRNFLVCVSLLGLRRIKISHRDTYTRNHSIWRRLLCIYLFTNLMYTITIFNVLRVSLTDSVQYVLIHISLFSFCCCNLLLLLTMSALKCSNFFWKYITPVLVHGPLF